VRSAVRNGVKAVVVSTPDTAARHTYLLINEGGGRDLIKPWAVVVSQPASDTAGGDCGTGFAAALVATWDYASSFGVPPNAYTVVGGG
jgi:hypothetical protein